MEAGSLISRRFLKFSDFDCKIAITSIIINVVSFMFVRNWMNMRSPADLLPCGNICNGAWKGDGAGKRIAHMHIDMKKIILSSVRDSVILFIIQVIANLGLKTNVKLTTLVLSTGIFFVLILIFNTLVERNKQRRK